VCALPDVAKRSRGQDLSLFTKLSKWQEINAKTLSDWRSQAGVTSLFTLSVLLAGVIFFLL